jgi:streptomycin 6-kinase
MPDGREVVLKTGLWHEDQEYEVEALRAYGGRTCCELVADDRPSHTFLVERFRPGTMLSELEDDDEATRIAAGIMRGLRVAPHPGSKLPTIADWGKGLESLRARFDGASGPFPERFVALAEETYATLGGPGPDDIVLHGDLHHFNILRAARAPWLAIDPHGVIGPPVYETGALLRNPKPALSTDPKRQSRRIDILAEELGLERDLIVQWAVAQAVLSVWWSLEGREEAEPDQLAVVDALGSLL